MRARDVTLWLVAICLLSTACLRIPTHLAEPTEPLTIDGLINCAYHTPVPEQNAILPAFEPDQACALENIEVREDICMVNASPDMRYPCYRMERVQETELTSNNDSVFIQRDYRIESGCWTMTSTDTRSLRLCNRENGESQLVAEDILGPLTPSPDGSSYTFVAPEPESYRTLPHIYRIDIVDGNKTQLDTQAFPQAQVSGAVIEGWSEDGEWLRIRLWDGSADGYYSYNLRSDGSGEFTELP